MGMGGDVKIVGRAMPMPFGEYELGVKGNAPADCDETRSTTDDLCNGGSSRAFVSSGTNANMI